MESALPDLKQVGLCCAKVIESKIKCVLLVDITEYVCIVNVVDSSVMIASYIW